MLCALATLITVPVLMASGASSDGEEIAAVAVTDTVSAVELEADVDMDALFDAGADLDAVPEIPVDERGVSNAANVVAAAPQSLIGATAQDAQVEAAQTVATSSAPVTSTTISAAPATPVPAPTTAPPTTAAPTTQAPTPTTAAPTTAAPTTEQPTTTTAPPVVEEPQAAVTASTPTAEQWAALRHCEASGNYSIVSSNGLYHGAYQFYQPTWDGLANQLGRSDLVGLAPSQAAPADQDALALLLWQQRGNQPWPHCGRHLPAGP